MSKTSKKKPTTKRTRPAAIKYDKFVKLWTVSSSVAEVAKTLGIKTNSASAIAARLRASGVKLRKFPRRDTQPVDTKKLNKLLEAR